MDSNDVILQTTPEPKYSFLVEEIMADKISRGYNDMYKECDKTSYDPIVIRLQQQLNILNNRMKENRSIMNTIINDIENSKKKSGEAGYKKVSAKELDEWQKMIMKLQEDYVTYKASADTIKPGLEDILFNQYIEVGQRRTMRFLRNKYLDDGDQEYLEKGVTWAANYAARHRLKIDMKAYT
jgi:hypothetical protein